MTVAIRCGRLLDVGAGEVDGDPVLHVADDGRIEVDARVGAAAA